METQECGWLVNTRAWDQVSLKLDTPESILPSHSLSSHKGQAMCHLIQATPAVYAPQKLVIAPGNWNKATNHPQRGRWGPCISLLCFLIFRISGSLPSPARMAGRPNSAWNTAIWLRTKEAVWFHLGTTTAESHQHTQQPEGESHSF
jgi:hypothetical protein